MIKKNFFLIPYRYLTFKKKDSAINAMIKVCFAGITIATCALALVVSVMQGFEKTTHQTMQSIYPDIIIDAHTNQIDVELIKPILEDPQYGITAFSEQRIGQAILHHQEQSQTPNVICLKGIDPQQELSLKTISTKITQPEKNDFLPMLTNNNICIGYKLAKYFHLKIGDTVQLLYTSDEPESMQVKFQQTDVVVGGVFKTGVEDFDSNLVYCNATFFDSLFPDHGVNQLYLNVKKGCNEKESIKLLEKKLRMDIYSWKELYPALISALKLEKYAMFFVLLLIVLIASMNSISLIFMYITQKKKEIALLICLGTPIRKIKFIFMTISLFIATAATSLGLSIAYLLGKVIETYPIIKLPEDAYFSTHLPIELDPTVFFVIFIASICIVFITSIISTRRLHNLNLISTLKNS